MIESSVIRKIKKLMRLADPTRGASSGEVDNALKLIDKLMRENNLSMSEIGVDAENSVNVTVSESTHIPQHRIWQRYLAFAVGKLCDSQSVCTRQSGQSWIKFHFIGAEKDVRLAHEAFQIFLHKIKAGASLFQSQEDRRSYCDGFALVFAHRVDELLKSRRKTEESAALVFVGKKEGAIKKFMEEKNIKVKNIPDVKQEQTPAFYRGVKDGQEVDLDVKPKPAEIGAASGD